MVELSVIEFGEEQHRLCEEKGDFAEGRFWLAYLNGARAQKSEDKRLGAVHVVRCKDCRRRYDHDECPMCCLTSDDFFEYTRDDGFCDRGERKDGEE